MPKVDTSSAAFPDFIRIGNARLSLSYRHTPDDPERDGITCSVHKKDAAVLRLWNAEWLVPGALPEKLSFLLGVLPSSLRRIVQPISDTVAVLMPLLHPDETPLCNAVRKVLHAHNGIFIPASAWENVKYPPHLRVRYRIKDDDGRIIAETRNLDEALAAAGIGKAASGSVGATAKSTTWTFGEIDEKAESSAAAWTLTHYPALADEGDGVSVRIFTSADAAAASHAAGLTRLICLHLTRLSRPSFSTSRLPVGAALYLKTIGYDCDRIAADILWAAVRAAAVDELPVVRTNEAFEARIKERRAAIDAAKAEMATLFCSILSETAECSDRLDAAGLPDDIADPIATQLAWLVFPGFMKAVPPERLRHYARYLKGVRTRIDRAKFNPAGDRSKEARFAPFWERCRAALVSKDTPAANRAKLDEYRWMVEEFRISVFAPELKTSVPVSEKRLDALWSAF